MAFPKDVYGAVSLTGGGQGALDAIDGIDLDDLDIARVTTATLTYFYSLDIDSGAAESPPDIIAPDVNAGDKRWILTGVAGAAGVPTGVICMWGGLLVDIPAGWALCDGGGAPARPDLRERFILGWSNGVDPGGTGGSDSITLAIANLPSHTHGTGTLVIGNESAHTHAVGSLVTNNIGAHTHAVGTLAIGNESAHTHAVGSLVTNNIGAHTHAVGTLVIGNESAHTHAKGTIAAANESAHTHPFRVGQGSGGALIWTGTITSTGSYWSDPGNNVFAGSAHTHTISGSTAAGSAHNHSISGATASNGNHTHTISGSTAAGSAHNHSISGATASNGNHTHTISGSTAAGSAHTHTLSGATAATGGGTAFNNRPAYYELAFIIKT